MWRQWVDEILNETDADGYREIAADRASPIDTVTTAMFHGQPRQRALRAQSVERAA